MLRSCRTSIYMSNKMGTKRIVGNKLALLDTANTLHAVVATQCTSDNTKKRLQV